MTCNTYNSPTSKGSGYALTPEQLRAKIFTFDQIIKYEQDPVARYNYADLIVALAAVPMIYEKYGLDSNGVTLYPYLAERLEVGQITPTEYASFVATSGLNFSGILALINSNISSLNANDYLSQLDLFFNKNFPSSETGSFCSAFTGKLMQLFGLLSAGANLLNQLKNGISSLISRLSSIKTLLTNLVDKLKDYMLKQIQGIIRQITAGVTSAVLFFTNKIKQVQDFFSDIKMNGLKAKIEEIIAGIAGGYEKLTPEIIAYILYRLCQLSEFITNFMKSPVDALKDLFNNYLLQKMALTNFSNAARLNAINAGAYRMDEFEIARQKAELANRINTNGNTPGLEPSYRIDIPFTEAERQKVINLTDAGNEHVTFLSGVLDDDDPVKGAGYRMVESGVWIRFFRVATRMGMRFMINSAYRSPSHNARVGGAKNSLHKSGKAIDVNMSSLSRDQIAQFIKFASEEGFGGIEYYQGHNFVHLDIGSKRRWYPGNGGGVIEESIQKHMNGTFGQARPAPSTSFNAQ